MKYMLFRLLTFSVLYFFCTSSVFAFGPDRRQDQFGIIPGYLVVLLWFIRNPKKQEVVYNW